jgi:hypothetical protein
MRCVRLSVCDGRSAPHGSSSAHFAERLQLLEAVDLVNLDRHESTNGGRSMDLVVSIEMVKTDDGKRVGRIHLLKELAERAEIWLNTHTKDGKFKPGSRVIHVIPIAGYLKERPTAATRPDDRVRHP